MLKYIKSKKQNKNNVANEILIEAEKFSAAATIKQLDSNATIGLSEIEVQKRLQKYSYNKLDDPKKQSLFIKFLAQFKDIMIIVLLVATAISFAMCGVYWDKEGAVGLIEPFVILFIVLLNAFIAVYQQIKAERSLEALKKMTLPKSKVIRDGAKQIIDTICLVPGDIIILEAGDFIPADGRIIESSSLKCDESALTGESLDSEKNVKLVFDKKTALGDRKNMVYSGCSVTYGTAKVIVTKTGMGTEMGKIATLLTQHKRILTPLEKRLNSLGIILSIVAVFVCLIMFLVGWFAFKMDWLLLLMTSISLAVAAIPEGLSVIVTVVLSVGTLRLSKENAIVKNLGTVETLGSTSVVCSDKTGTLTQNKMTLTLAYSDQSTLIEDISKNNTTSIVHLLELGILDSNGAIVTKGNKVQSIGDPTETSIVAAGIKNNILQAQLNNKYPRFSEIAFDSERKLMTTVNKIGDDYVAIVKGSFDALVKICINGDLNKAQEVNETFSSKALRVIAIATRKLSKSDLDNITIKNIEKDLTFVGLVGMIDPPRPEARAAVKDCKSAGIKTVMITGDHILTASAIAKELGILNRGERAITGGDLELLSDQEFEQQIRNISVYARVSPADKIRIVKMWQKLGEVVAMTGDGVNDAPALKAADIGCAMGIVGTDIAKDTANVILTDDNFATIAHAIKYGRGAYDNIKRVISFLLGANIGEILMVFIGLMIWQVSPLISIQLLWINLISDSLPAIALGMEKNKANLMFNKPIPRKQNLFANKLWLVIALQGIMIGGLSLGAFAFGYYFPVLGLDPDPAINKLICGSTMGFLVLGFSQCAHVFNLRSSDSLFKSNPFGNKYLNYAVTISAALLAFVGFIPPIATAFGMGLLNWQLYLIVIALSFATIPLSEVYKLIAMLARSKKASTTIVNLNH